MDASDTTHLLKIKVVFRVPDTEIFSKHDLNNSVSPSTLCQPYHCCHAMLSSNKNIKKKLETILAGYVIARKEMTKRND